MKRCCLCLALMILAGCASQQLAEELIVPEFPEHETIEISLSVYDKDGSIAKQIYDSNDYSDEESPRQYKDAITFTEQNDSPEVQWTTKYNVPPNSWIVISIPDDVRQGSMRKNTENVRDAKSTTDKVEVNPSNIKDGKEFYSTTGYYNYAENQIEKRLLGIGFNVVDRSKYLAKIKEISESGFEDVSDVIRLAAKDSTIRSDYILQINKFSFGKVKKTLVLRKYPKVKKYLDEFPKMAPKVPKVYRYPEYNVVFDGKLIEVKTGKIMWLGTHSINSGHVLIGNKRNIEINIDTRRYVSNKKEIDKFYSFQNTPEQRAKRYGKIIEAPPVKYDYSFDFSVDPNFNDLEKEGTDNELFKGHREALIKLVTRELVKTISKDYYCKQELNKGEFYCYCEQELNKRKPYCRGQETIQ